MAPGVPSPATTVSPEGSTRTMSNVGAGRRKLSDRPRRPAGGRMLVGDGADAGAAAGDDSCRQPRSRAARRRGRSSRQRRSGAWEPARRSACGMARRGRAGGAAASSLCKNSEPSHDAANAATPATPIQGRPAMHPLHMRRNRAASLFSKGKEIKSSYGLLKRFPDPMSQIAGSEPPMQRRPVASA